MAAVAAAALERHKFDSAIKTAKAANTAKTRGYDSANSESVWLNDAVDVVVVTRLF